MGLRGGSFTVAQAQAGYRVTLNEVRWTEDVSVSGSIVWPGRVGLVQANLTLQTPAGAGALELAWSEGSAEARATARGELGGRVVFAEAPAP